MVVVVMTGDMVAMDEEVEVVVVATEETGAMVVVVVAEVVIIVEGIGAMEVVEIMDHTNTYQTYIVHNNLVMCTIHRFNICDFFQLM